MQIWILYIRTDFGSEYISGNQLDGGIEPWAEFTSVPGTDPVILVKLGKKVLSADVNSAQSSVPPSDWFPEIYFDPKLVLILDSFPATMEK